MIISVTTSATLRALKPRIGDRWIGGGAASCCAGTKREDASSPSMTSSAVARCGGSAVQAGNRLHPAETVFHGSSFKPARCGASGTSASMTIASGSALTPIANETPSISVAGSSSAVAGIAINANDFASASGTTRAGGACAVPEPPLRAGG